MSHYSLRSSSKTTGSGQSSSDIFNGARCESYSWSQGHGDLEIRVKLAKAIEQDQISVAIAKSEICVNLKSGQHKKETLLKGKFEHEIDVESAYWVVEKEGPHLAIFMDKAEEMWWKKLLDNENAFEHGPKHFTVPMDHMDGRSRMVIDKLITCQKRKLSLAGKADDRLSPA